MFYDNIIVGSDNIMGGSYSIEQLSAGNYSNLMTANEAVEKLSDRPTGDSSRLDAKRNRNELVNNQLAFLDMMKDTETPTIAQQTNPSPITNELPGAIKH